MIWKKGIYMSTQSVGIDIAAETIGHLLQEKNLQVPLSQRSYRWEEEHVTELYQDINGAIHAGSDEYFIGSIVGIKLKGITNIYDGQQRLATSMILIAAIRDYFSASNDPKTAQLIESESLISTHRQTHEETPHFRLNSEDQQYFHNSILLHPITNSAGMRNRNATLIRELVRQQKSHLILLRHQSLRVFHQNKQASIFIGG